MPSSHRCTPMCTHPDRDPKLVYHDEYDDQEVHRREHALFAQVKNISEYRDAERRAMLHEVDCDDWECTGCLQSPHPTSVYEAESRRNLNVSTAEEVLKRAYGPALRQQVENDNLILNRLPRPTPVKLTWRGRFYNFKDEWIGRFLGAWSHLRYGECWDYYDD